MREGKEVHIKGIGYYEVSRDAENPRNEGCEGIGDMHCLSDEYLADELLMEWKAKNNE